MSSVVFGDAIVPVLRGTAGRRSARPAVPLCGEPCSTVGLLFGEGHGGSFQRTVQLKGGGRCTWHRHNRGLNDSGKWMGAGHVPAVALQSVSGGVVPSAVDVTVASPHA